MTNETPIDSRIYIQSKTGFYATQMNDVCVFKHHDLHEVELFLNKVDGTWLHEYDKFQYAKKLSAEIMAERPPKILTPKIHLCKSKKYPQKKLKQ